MLSAESAVPVRFQKFIAVKIRYTLKEKKTPKQRKALEIVLEGEWLLNVLLQLNQTGECVYLACILRRKSSFRDRNVAVSAANVACEA